MNKLQIKTIAKICFDAGKNNLPDSQFDEYFERYYMLLRKTKLEDVDEAQEVKRESGETTIWN